MKLYITALVNELYGVLYEVIHDLMHKVVISIKGHSVNVKPPYLYLLFLKPWLKSHKGIDYRLKHREILQIRFKLACLDLCKIEHTSYEPCKSVYLRGNYLKIISLLLLWYGAVKQTVHKTAYRRHRRSKLMRNVRKEAISHGVIAFQAGSHIVESVAELFKLRGRIIRQRDRKISCSYLL